MKNSQISIKTHEFNSRLHPDFINEKISTLKITEEMMEPKQPHESFFLVLAYLNLFELLTTSKVCRSLRDAINKDVLLWLDIVVESPLNLRLNDDILLKITSKAQGRLRTLALMNCVRITDDGLQRVIEKNLHINKSINGNYSLPYSPVVSINVHRLHHHHHQPLHNMLYVPECTRLTPDGIVRIVKKLTENNNSLKLLRMNNLPNTTKDHLQALYSCLKIMNPLQQQKPNLFHDFPPHLPLFKPCDTNRPIDIEVCPRCNDVGLVFDCSRESCTTKSECRGCYDCIPRCEGCGGCVESEEIGETICFDIVCLDCWLRLPKCNFCNKSYCNRHVNERGWSKIGSSGFVCDVCSSGTMNDEFFGAWRSYD